MTRLGNIFYHTKLVEDNDPNLPEYEKYSAVLINKPTIVEIMYKDKPLHTRIYQVCTLIYYKEKCIYVEGLYSPYKGSKPPHLTVSYEDLDPKILTGLMSASQASGGKRVHIRGRRGGVSKYPGYTYWRSKYPNIRGYINAKK